MWGVRGVNLAAGKPEPVPGRLQGEMVLVVSVPPTPGLNKIAPLPFLIAEQPYEF